MKNELWLHSLPNGKILDWSRFKEFAEDKINVTENIEFLLERLENIVGKGENAGYQHFLLFAQPFSKGLSLRVLKSQDCVVKN